MAVTQAQIAELAGVSRGTVDRALNDRGRVDPAVAARIRALAQELGYRRNRAGSLLQRTNRPIKLGILLQPASAPFFQHLLPFLQAARSRFAQMGAELHLRTVENTDPAAQRDALEELLTEGIDGLVLTPLDTPLIRARLQDLAEQLPIITVHTPLTGVRPLCQVRQNDFRSGRTAAGLMGLLLNGRGKILLLSDPTLPLPYPDRIAGFRTELTENFPQLLPLSLPAVGTPQTLSDCIEQALLLYPDLNGIYLAAGDALPGCAALSRHDHKIHLVCHDCTTANCQALRTGLADFVIDHNAPFQAIRPLELLLDFLLEDKPPEEPILFASPNIHTRYTI